MKTRGFLIQQTFLATFLVALIRKFALILGFLAIPAFGTSYYWVGGGASASAPAGGNWDNSTTDWSTTSTGSGSAWGAAGSTAVFGGVDGSYGVSVNVAVNKPQILLFSNSGYTLSNSTTPETITINGAGSGAAPNIQVASGKIATIGTNVTVDDGTTTIWGSIQSTAGGELDIANGGALTADGVTDGQVGAGTLISVKTGGKMTIQSACTTFLLGSQASDNCTLSVDGGTVLFQGSAAIKVGGSGTAASIGGTITVNAGSFSMYSGNTTVSITNGILAGCLGTNNLNGGVFSVNRIIQGQGNGYINFNGGTLQAVNGAFASSFLNGLATANVRNGGAVIDNNGFGISIGQALLHSTIFGDNATDGGLTVTNSGTAGSLTLTNANTYNGPTVIETGAYLATTTRSTGAGSYSVNDGAALEVQVPAAAGQLAMSSLTEGTSGNLTNVFTLGANASTTIPAVAISGALALNGTVTVNLSGSGLTGPNTYVLMSFASVGGSGSFVAGALPTVVGYNATLVTTATQLQLVYTAVPSPIKWAVGNANWDTTTANWQPLAGGSPVDYSEGTPVLFDDTASGNSPITVTLTGNHAPNVVTNNSTKDYIFAGSSFNLSSAALAKSGSGTLTIDNGNGNEFLSINIGGGTLQIGNNDTNGSLGSGNVTDNGILAFQRTDNPTFANLISGAGSVIQNGGGSVTLSNTNSYSGSSTVSAGNLITTTLSTGAGSYSVSNLAALTVQVSEAGTSLTNDSLTLGTLSSDKLTNDLTLGGNASTTIPAVRVQGTLTVNGSVTVNVSGTLASGTTYPLIGYGSLAGSGSFVMGTVPAVTTNYATLVMANNQLQLVYTPVPSLTWDSGNTNNGSTIDAGSGTWDKNPANFVWNDNGLNLSWLDDVPAIFAGADGNWTITLATNVAPLSLDVDNNGYTFVAVTPEIITFPYGGSGGNANCNFNNTGVVTIGTNVTAQCTSTYVLYGANGGTVDIADGGTILETNASTFDLAGVLTYNVLAGGSIKATYVGTSATGGFGIGVLTGDNTALNIDGGTVSLAGTNNMGINIATGIGSSGTLTINSGTVSMSASNTAKTMVLASAIGSTATVNLNGGVLAVTCLTNANASGTATVNFNGGTLEAVNGAFGSTFMTQFQEGGANVLAGGAVINNNGFNLTVGQALSNGGGPDGGLISFGSGSLTLTGANTYNGNTVVNGGRLALSGSASLSSSAGVVVAGGATFDVSALGSVVLGSGQLLSNSTSTATLDGSLDANAGTVSLTYVSGAPSFAVTNGTLTLSSGTTFHVNNTGSALTAGSYELIAANNGGVITGTLPSFTVGGSGLASGATAALQVNSGNLYLVVTGGTPPPTPHITGISVTGTTLTLTATNGAGNGVYELLESTNLTLPLNQWQPVLTNTFNASGILNLSTNIVSPNVPHEFYILWQ